MRTRGHTNAAEGIDNLVSLLLIVQLPGMLEGSDSLVVHLRSLILLSKVQTVEDKDTGHPQVLENLQLLFDIASQGERESSKSNEKRLAGRGVVEVLRDVVRRIDTDNCPFEGGEGKR